MQWRKYPDEQPPLNVRVLVCDGEELGLDTFIEHYEIDGRTLLPSDSRRKTLTPELRFSRYVNVTHWMHVELPKGEGYGVDAVCFPGAPHVEVWCHDIHEDDPTEPAK